MAPFYAAGEPCLPSPLLIPFPLGRTHRIQSANHGPHTTGLIILYGVNSFATVLENSDEYKNDPRNPASKTAKPANEKH
ncbi:mitochondrial f1f0 atp synthase subunit atp18 [Lasallia pustulata]|uniref:Mitochondrial f1f0 atp synthase subunit atp18 n=1 Tax=Lasallia pustulata TaxID=136370 RepID=A0A1W5CVA9_9LECA|nr:mitochondrial f1f0 atp synthase subunit atp18 [Lasallia pustulata]